MDTKSSEPVTTTLTLAIFLGMTLKTQEESFTYQWAEVRSTGFHSVAEKVIRLSSPTEIFPVAIAHVRTAHYAAYRVDDSAHNSWLVRIGVSAPSDLEPASNSGYLGTSISTPTGQHREAAISQAFENCGADVIAIAHHTHLGSLDVTWTPFICGSNEAMTALQWHRALTGLYSYSPHEELPVFTNRAKTMQRLSEFSDVSLALSLQKSYDAQLKELFKVSSKWSVIHGDAHGGNALVSNDKALLFDFDTVCWAPSVWDLTHLLNRAGVGVDSGYSVKSLTELFDFTSEEIDAALTLRRIASKIALTHRNLG